MLGPGLIDHLDHGSQSGGLALTDRSDDQEESLRLPGECLENRRQIELGQSTDDLGDETQSYGQATLDDNRRCRGNGLGQAV